MSQVSSEEQLLFGVLAVQLGFATPAQVMAAGAAWMADRELGLAERLEAMGAIKTRQRVMVQAMLGEAVLANQGSVHETLSALGGEAVVDQTFAGSLVLEASGEVHPAAEAATTQPDGQGPQDSLILAPDSPERYHFRGEHGRGGQARVLVAFDQNVGREIAWKELHGDRSGDSSSAGSASRTTSAMARFLREARITGQLEHPNIVPVHELGEKDNGQPYYTMRLVRGQTLSSKLAGCQGLDDRMKLLGSVWDMCNGIAYAHSRGVVHRDIKPDNVVVGEFGETVILDWGLAKAKGSDDQRADDLERQVELLHHWETGQTVDGSAMGTPSYMSPEQAEGDLECIDERSDVWGLGAVLYELLTGQPPFTGETPFEIVGKVMKDAIQPVAQLCPEAPPDLAAVAEKALQRDPADRYQSAKELASDVSAYITGRRVAVYRYSSMELLRRFIGRNKALVAAASLLMVVIVLSLVGLHASLKGESRARQREHRALERVEAERRASAYHLAQALADKGDQMMAHKLFGSAAIYWAGSLLNNPAHPLSPLHRAEFGIQQPEAGWLMVETASRLYQMAFEPRLELEQVLSLGSAATGVALSPDGELVAGVGYRPEVVLWSRGAASSKRLLQGHMDRVYALAISPDGRWLASGSRDNTVRLWSLPGGKQERILRGHSGRVLAVAFSPDSGCIASSSVNGAILIWCLDREQPPLVLRGHTSRVYGLAYSPDGRLIASAGADQTVRLWDARDGQPIATLKGLSSHVRTVAFSPDGATLAAGGLDGQVILWDVASRKPRLELSGHVDAVDGVAFSPDGSQLATACYDNKVRLFDARSGRQLVALNAHGGFITGITYSVSGSRIATASYDGTIKLWHVRAGDRLDRLRGHSQAIYAVASSPDGRWLATGSWDRTARIWDLRQAALHATLEGHTDLVNKVAFSPDSRQVLTESRDRSVMLWKVADGSRVRSLGTPGESYNAAVFSPDGATVALASSDGTVQLVDPATNERKGRLVASDKPIEHVTFSPDGRRLAAVGFDRLGRVWDLASGKVSAVLRGHTDWASGVAFSPDGRRLVTGSKDGRAGVWDADTGELLRWLEGHAKWINTVAWSADGRLIATASDDHSARVWFADDGRMGLVLSTRAEVAGVAFTPDSHHLAVGDAQDAILYPMRFDIGKSPPSGLLDASQRSAGMRLDGFELVHASGQAAGGQGP